MNTNSKPSLLHWYGLLALIASIFGLQAILFPRWPRVASILPEASKIEAALKRAGLQPKRLKLNEPFRSINAARSEVIGFQLSDGSELRLTQASVRERKNFQTAMINRDLADIHIVNRQLINDMPYSSIGKINEHPAIESCLVRQANGKSAYGVTNDQLTATVDPLSHGGSAAIRRIIGLDPNRSYECVLISLQSTIQNPINIGKWNHLLFTLQNVLSTNTGLIMEPESTQG